MEKLYKFFITTLVAGLVAFSSALAIPTQMAQALIGTNQIADNAITSQKIRDGEVKTPDLATAAVTKEKLNPSAIRLVVVTRTAEGIVAAHSARGIAAECNPDEVVTGGGYDADNEIVVTVNGPTGGNDRWNVNAFSNSDSDQQFIAFVKCAHLELGP